VIAAINGACAGIGLITAVNCDLRFASATAKFTTAFANRGITATSFVEKRPPELAPRDQNTPTDPDPMRPARHPDRQHDIEG
jgi:enoyl-CoA hydratase/carnithine racemase